MVRHVAKKERRPALVFVGAAALVVLLAVPLLLMNRGEDPVVAGSSTTSSAPVTSTTVGSDTTTTGVDTTTTTNGSTTSTQVAMPVWSQPVFFYQSPTDSFLGNPAMVPVWIEVTPLNPDALFTEALAATQAGSVEPLANAVPPSVQVVGLDTTTIDGDEVWVADMSEAFLEGAGGLLADVTMLNQLVYTLTDNTIESVLFTVGGETIETFGTEGIDLSEPVTRDSYLDELHVINLTDPIVEGDGGWRVAGIANVFEANLAVNVLDRDGSVVHEEFVQASCGSGCWGEFETTLDSDLIVPGESSVRLLTYSAEDGLPTNMITIPIPEEGIWQLNAEE